MDCKINVRLHSKRMTVRLQNIVVPKEFGVPKPEKIIKHCGKHFSEYNDLDPILVDDSLTLIDGYISLLILQTIGRETVDVFKITPKVKFIREDTE